jgi:hypothetical protein
VGGQGSIGDVRAGMEDKGGRQVKID